MGGGREQRVSGEGISHFLSEAHGFRVRLRAGEGELWAAAPWEDVFTGSQDK